jgi:hypothetical protein
MEVQRRHGQRNLACIQRLAEQHPVNPVGEVIADARLFLITPFYVEFPREREVRQAGLAWLGQTHAWSHFRGKLCASLKRFVVVIFAY